MKELWGEKYRPKKVKEYVFRDEKQERQVQSWIDSKAIPHLMFSGDPGTGKTTYLMKRYYEECRYFFSLLFFLNFLF